MHAWPCTWRSLCLLSLWCSAYGSVWVLWWLDCGRIYPYPSGLHHWHWGNPGIAPVPVKWPWRIWVNKSRKSAKEDDITKIYENVHQIYMHILWDTCSISCGVIHSVMIESFVDQKIMFRVNFDIWLHGIIRHLLWDYKISPGRVSIWRRSFHVQGSPY